MILSFFHLIFSSALMIYKIYGEKFSPFLSEYRIRNTKNILYLCGMKFSKEYQPPNRRKPSGKAKVTMSVRVPTDVKDYYDTHKGEAQEVLIKHARRYETRRD